MLSTDGSFRQVIRRVPDWNPRERRRKSARESTTDGGCLTCKRRYWNHGLWRVPSRVATRSRHGGFRSRGFEPAPTGRLVDSHSDPLSSSQSTTTGFLRVIPLTATPRDPTVTVPILRSFLSHTSIVMVPLPRRIPQSPATWTWAYRGATTAEAWPLA